MDGDRGLKTRTGESTPGAEGPGGLPRDAPAASNCDNASVGYGDICGDDMLYGKVPVPTIVDEP